MGRIEEENKILLNKRTSLINIMIVLTGGIAGIIISGLHNILSIGLLITGIYFDVLFLLNVLSIDVKLERNIKEL